ncbi:MAG: GDP-L-fucose synthase [Nitrospirae bacterium]|nr:GDP-L-fucose synthase [Nitrospirota bacterium]
METTSKTYIAGHRGMVGSALMRNLRVRGHENIVSRAHSELDLTRQTETEKFFENEKPDYVFLSAAKVGGILANNTYKADFIYQNIMIAANVIHSAYKHGVKKLLNLGSSCIYPKYAPQPMKEEFLLTGALEPTNEAYAIAKISAIKLCRYYNEQYGTNFLSVMPTNLYGSNDNYNLETSHVFPAFIRKFHLAKLLRNRDYQAIKKDLQIYPPGFNMNNEEILQDEKSMTKALEKLGITEGHVLLWGAGEIYREFLHSDDLADACIFLISNYGHKELGDFVNIGSGEDIRIKDLAVLIKRIIGFEGEIRHDLSKPEGAPRKLLDVSKIKKLGWEAKIGLEQGIVQTYESYCRNVSSRTIP